MSATKSTTNYNLPIFIASDSPKWLVDWNGAMNTIDSAINTVATAASGAAGDITTLQSDLQTLSGTVTTQGTSISTLTSSLSTLTGTVNTITSLIGNGEPTTTDKTIIGAINELHADIQQIVVSVNADDVSYDNTTSGLTATNVQDAIDEIATGTPIVEKRRIVSIGDSYAITQTGVTNSYATQLETLFGNDVDFYDLHENGMGIIVRGGSNHTALELLQAERNNIPNHDTITDFIITVGENDSNAADISGLSTAIGTLMTYIKTNYPKARVYYGFIGNIISCPDVNKDRIKKWLKTIPVCMNTFGDNGAVVMDGIQYVMHDARNLQSPLFSHPSETGALEIAKFIYQFVTTGHAKYFKWYEYVGAGDEDYSVIIDGAHTQLIIINTKQSEKTGTINGVAQILATPSDFPIRGSYNYEYCALGQIGLTINNASELVGFTLWKNELTAIHAGSASYTNVTKGTVNFDTLLV